MCSRYLTKKANHIFTGEGVVSDPADLTWLTVFRDRGSQVGAKAPIINCQNMKKEMRGFKPLTFPIIVARLQVGHSIVPLSYTSLEEKGICIYYKV